MGTVSEDVINITHGYNNNQGPAFFSCCSVRLGFLVRHIIDYKKLPKILDSSKTFTMYKNNKDQDITFNYFEDYNNIDIIYNCSNTINLGSIGDLWNFQFSNYHNFDYSITSSLVKKYFSPNTEIINIIKNIENKYNIDYNNTCCIFFRGLDKITETRLPHYNEYALYIDSIILNNPNIKLLIQSDETEFIAFMVNKYPNNTFYFKDEIRHLNRSINLVDKVFNNIEHFSKNFLAITIIMSKCKYIICNGGTNVSAWILFYRGNSNNVIEYLNGTWHL